MREFSPNKVPYPPENPHHHLYPFLFNPLDIEIGAGNGEHALFYAKKNPKRCLIAFEKTHNRFLSFNKKTKNMTNPNLISIQGDAIWWISHYIKKNQVSNYFILYPNPYPKRRQSHLRFVNMPFMKCLIETLKPKGKIMMTTNEKFYFDEAIEKMRDFWRMKVLRAEKISKESYFTSFERKFLKRKEVCYEMVFEKEDS